MRDAKLIKLCRRRGWHVICALKQNRKFTKKGTNKSRQLRKHAHYTRNRDFKSASWRIKSSDSSTRYWVSSQQGYLNDIKDEVSIFISKRHPTDRSPEYFMTTDLSLSPPDGLSRYGRRWTVEIETAPSKKFKILKRCCYEKIFNHSDFYHFVRLAIRQWKRTEGNN